MMLRNEPPQRQQQIISRIWSAIGIKADAITDELFEEWIDCLADLDLKAITERVEYWRGQNRTCPADEFAMPVGGNGGAEKEVIGSSLTPKQVVERAKKLYAASDETLDESYRNLGLHKRWGPLPEDRRG